jgi:outer membrane protein
MKKIVILLVLIAGIVQAHAQEKWSLQKCVDYALSNNILIKQSQLNTEYRGNEMKQSKNNRLPELSANLGQGVSFGRSLTIDNTYDNFTSASTSASASANVLIWRGGTVNNTIKQQEFEWKASLENLQKAKDDVTLNIASGYLEILFAKELIKVAEKQVAQTRMQIDRTMQLIAAGKVAEGALLEIQSQLAREELDVVNRQNRLQIALLNLAQLLELENYTNFDIEVPELPEIKAQATVVESNGVYDKAIVNRPEIKSSEYKLRSSEMQLKIAEGSKYPTLAASAGINNYFLASKQVPFGFSDQISKNLGENIGLNLYIPIFSRFATRTNIANAKLQVEDQELQFESAKKELRKQIEQAYTNAVAALKRYNSSQIAVKSMQESFRYVDEKFTAGRVNSVEYNDSKTRLALAESELIQAKFEFLFRSKILDFYNGIPIEL